MIENIWIQNLELNRLNQVVVGNHGLLCAEVSQTFIEQVFPQRGIITAQRRSSCSISMKQPTVRCVPRVD